MPAPKSGRAPRRSDVFERVQALTMHACGKNGRDVESITGIASGAFSMLLKKAKSRGYVVGGKILEDHVCDGKPGTIKATVQDPTETPTPGKAAARRTPKKAAAAKATASGTGKGKGKGKGKTTSSSPDADADADAEDEDDEMEDAKQPKLEPMEDYDDDYAGDGMKGTPSQPTTEAKPKPSASYTPEESPSASASTGDYNTEPIPFNLQGKPFKLEPMEDDEEDEYGAV